MTQKIVGIEITHNAPGLVAGVPAGPELLFEPHNAGSLNCWCRPLVEALVMCADGQIRPVRRS